MQKLRWVTGFVLAALLGFGVDALAGGFAFNENGAAATGKATAFVGEANDPSAIFYNPAGITQLPGTQVMIGASLVKLDSTFRSATTVESTQLQDQFPVYYAPVQRLGRTAVDRSWDIHALRHPHRLARQLAGPVCHHQ